MSELNDLIIRECIEELDTIKRRLLGMLSNQKVEVFTAPELHEVIDYFYLSEGQEPMHRSPRDLQWMAADSFHKYYEANGWKVGKNKMKNWKAAASQWIARNKKREEDKRSSASDRHDQATKRFLGV